jgi:N-acetyl-1-D-myo-inositol-2-amino-2-deoxy-alpha-D-glucopyranoside deacetylase
LLAVFAHPDDETFGAGGTMALAASEGHPVWLVCATNGDEGGEADDSGDHAMDPEIRLAELRCACQALGIEDPIFLGYRDSGMETWTPKPGALVLADRDEVIGRIAAEIRRLRPAVVVTFDAGGIYGHPDHVTVSALATAAFERTHSQPGGPPVLYHQVSARSEVEAMLQRWGDAATAGDEPPEPSEDDVLQRERFIELSRPDEEITTRVDVRAVIERKLAALACHASQLRDARFDEATFEEREAWLGTETFVRVVPPPVPGERETALLAL